MRGRVAEVPRPRKGPGAETRLRSSGGRDRTGPSTGDLTRSAIARSHTRVKPLTARPLGLALLGLALASACDLPREPAPVRAREAARDPAPASAAVQAPRSRGRLLAGERVERVPVWPGDDALDRAVRERLPPDVRAVVDRAPVPVLAPVDPGWHDLAASSPRGPGGPGAGYTFSAREDGRTLVVQGSRLARLIPGIGRHEGRDRLRGVAGFVTDNDGIKSASWIEGNTAYSLDLECDAPESPRCDLTALRAEVERLVFVGGAGPRGGGR